MMQLADAITNRFPQGNDWATQALAALAGDFDPTTPVHDAVEGWTARGDYSNPRGLIDTLFVLTDDRLGLGQAVADQTLPRWIDLRTIVAVDAVDNSPLPLQTIELELGDGQVLCVGWPEAFSERLVPVLRALAEGRPVESADFPAPPAPAPRPAPPAPAPAPQSAPAAPRPALDFLSSAPAPSGPPTVAAPPAPPVPEAFAPPAPATVFEDSQAWSPVDRYAAELPTDNGGFAAPGTGAVPEVTLPAPPSGTAADSHTPPWQNPGMAWPDPLRGVLYLGGHPGYPRKRKNGTMVFSPNGLDVSGTGFQNWDMSMDWAFVQTVEVQGPDEIMFGDHLKIDSTSSGLIVTMTDETRMFFEVRTRRPPSLRAALAPVLLMVDNIRTFRAQA